MLSIPPGILGVPLNVLLGSCVSIRQYSPQLSLLVAVRWSLADG